MRKSYHLRKTYGMTLERFNEMYEQQKGKCAICMGNFEDMTRRHLNVDHDHETGAVRQLLCGNCNVALGALREDINLFEKAITYLKKWKP